MRFQAGEKEAFVEIYDIFVDRVHKYFYYKTSSSLEDAFDLTENLFLKVWENIASYKPREGSSFAAWVFRIAHNLLIDHYRLSQVVDELDTQHADLRREASPVFWAEQSLSRFNLRSALGRLKSNYREVITLFYINELDNAEVAEIMKKSEGSLRVLKFRALRELKKVLTEMGIRY